MTGPDESAADAIRVLPETSISIPKLEKSRQEEYIGVRTGDRPFNAGVARPSTRLNLTTTYLLTC